MKKSKLLILALIPVIGALSNCGESADPNTVVFWMTGSQKASEALKRKATQFSNIIEKQTGKKVTISIDTAGGYDDIKTKIEKGFAAGNVPTMAVAYPDHVADYLNIEDGKYVYNLEKYIHDADIGFAKQSYLGDEKDETDFTQSFWNEGKGYAQEGIYSLPYMKSSEVMFYNENAVFKALKARDPQITSDELCRSFLSKMTWDEFMALNQYIYTNKKTLGLESLKYSSAYDSDENLFISKLFQLDIEYSKIGENKKGIICYDKAYSQTNYDNAVAFVKKVQGYYNDHLMITKGANEGKYSSDLFKNEEVVFTIGSSGGTGYNMPEGEAFKVGCVKVPSSATRADNTNLYVSQGPTLTFLKNPKFDDNLNGSRMNIAWQFAKFITNPANNVELCVYGSEGYYPVRVSALSDENWIEYLKAGEIYAKSANVMMRDINGRYFNARPFKGSADLRSYSGGIVTSALLNQSKTVESIFDEAIEQAKMKMN